MARGSGAARLDHARIAAGAPARVSIEVTNAGDRDGDEVVQLYISRPVAGAPIRSLAGFQRIALKAGEARRVTFDIPAVALGVVDDAGKRQVPAGDAALWIGGGQPGTGAQGSAATLTITGSTEVAAF